MWNPSYLQINVQISINKMRYFMYFLNNKKKEKKSGEESM